MAESNCKRLDLEPQTEQLECSISDSSWGSKFYDEQVVMTLTDRMLAETICCKSSFPLCLYEAWYGQWPGPSWQSWPLEVWQNATGTKSDGEIQTPQKPSVRHFTVRVYYCKTRRLQSAGIALASCTSKSGLICLGLTSPPPGQEDAGGSLKEPHQSSSCVALRLDGPVWRRWRQRFRFPRNCVTRSESKVLSKGKDESCRTCPHWGACAVAALSRNWTCFGCTCVNLRRMLFCGEASFSWRPSNFTAILKIEWHLR